MLMFLHVSHLLHGFCSLSRLSQLRAFARMSAADVLPQPLGPEKRNPVGILLLLIAFFRESATFCCPIRLENLVGRYFL